MSATPVTFAEVLREEYEYFHEPDPPRDWTLRDEDVRDLHTLVARIRTIHGMQSGAAAASRPLADHAREIFGTRFLELASRCTEGTPDGVLAALRGMVTDDTLFAKLVADQSVRDALLDPANPLLRKLASVPHARRRLFTDADVARRIAGDPGLFEIFTAHCTPLRLIMEEGLHDLVRLYPHLLFTIADSAALDLYLMADGDPVRARARRRDLVLMFRNASTKRRPVKGFLRVRQQDVSEPDTQMEILSRDADALLARLTKYESVPEAVDEDAQRAALSQFNVLLLESAYGDHIADGHDLRDLYSRIHEKNVAALCLSGGGIRSATFNLGILQGLAEHKLLTQFHYLSTVSGGGYIGSWLSSWMRRHRDGPWGVAKDLCAKPEDPLAPEVGPIQHLRAHSSYLAPRGSALSVDTWTIVATYLRNLLLNWTMLIPALLALLIVPRVVEMLILAAMAYDVTYDIVKWVALLGLLTAVVAVGSVRPALDRQSDDVSPDDQRDRAARFRWWLYPLLVSGLAFMAYWATLLYPDKQRIFGLSPLDWRPYAILFGGASFIGAFLYSVRHVAASIGILSLPDRPLRNWWRNWRKPAADRDPGWTLLGIFRSLVAAVRQFRFREWWRAIECLFRNEWRRLGAEVLSATFAGVMGGILLYAFFKGLFPPESLDAMEGWPRLEVYVCVGLPLFLVVFFGQASLLAGLTTSWGTDYDREWWARSASWIFICGIAYLALAATVILGPIAIIEWKKIAASLGGTSAIVVWLLARGGKMAATPKEKEVVGAARWQTLSLRVASLVCLLFIVALLSVLTTAFLGWAGSNLDDLAESAAHQQIMLADTLLATAWEKLVDVLAHSTILQYWIDELKDRRITIFGIETSGALRWHFAVLRGSSELVIGVFLAAMMFVAGRMSRLLNVNIYSMHGMYRNRLIRAYLGASRVTRSPDPFTGFDPRDNLTMWQLRPEALWTSSCPDFDAFVRRLVEDESSATPGGPRCVLTQLPADVRIHVLTYDAAVKARLGGANVRHAGTRADIQSELTDALNRLMLERDLQHDVPQRGSIAALRANRAFLDARFADVLSHCPTDRPNGADANAGAAKIERHNGRLVGSTPRLRRRPPLHVLNMALNLVGGENLAWRERKADSFTVTPLHSGNKRLGYRDSVQYGEEISLGTAVAVSGAAVSPNHGYNSSPVVTFLMTLFNARLGWWLGNPGRAGEKTHDAPGPEKSIKSIFDEAFGLTTDTSEYVFLSDGGHFDNLGLYEMVLRRCRYIVVGDASQDQRYAFGDLANSVRKIRIDLGIDIRLKSMFIGPEDADPPQQFGQYCALGCIDYDRVDVIDKRYPQKGYILYVKPVVYADCPADVKNYRKEHDGFPHESTADQFFSESQFESYRALGLHSVKQICASLQGKRRSARMEEEARTIFQLFQGAANYLQEAKAAQLASDEAVNFLKKRKPRTAPL